MWYEAYYIYRNDWLLYFTNAKCYWDNWRVYTGGREFLRGRFEIDRCLVRYNKYKKIVSRVWIIGILRDNDNNDNGRTRG